MNGKESPPPKAKRASKARPSSREEFDQYFQEVGLYPRDAEATWNKWEGNGWSNGGKKIVCWKSTVRAWKASGYMPSQKNPSDHERDWPKERPDAPAEEEEDWMEKLTRLREQERREAAGDHPDFDETPAMATAEDDQCF